MRWWIHLLLACAVLSAASAQSLRINSPRNGNGNGQDDDEGSEEAVNGGVDKDVLVKLPSDLKAVLDLQKADRSRIHASILGLQPGETGDKHGQTNLDAILSEVSPPSPPPPPSSSTPPGRGETSTGRSLSTPPSSRRQPDSTSTNRRQKQRNNRKRDRNIGAAVTTKPASTPSTPGRRPPDSSPPDAHPSERSFWSLAWEAHIYFSGTLFVLLALYCLINILRLHTFSRLFSRGYFVGLNLCIVVVGLLRPLYLFVDPYNLAGHLPRVAAYVLLDTGFPCITSAFAILFLALLRATQIELVSPSFQTPRALATFCSIHLAISLAVDFTVGLSPSVRYLVLICQGFFIVWSLLLSAGYFYIFSAMKKVSLRSGGDSLRSYPKLVLDGAANGFPHSGDTALAAAATGVRPPLCRAVHLTLGVAVLGSLMGGVQLFGMIKMLGLQKADMTSQHNEWAWYGYQVSMRVLELTLCTLLAVIATTPLRSEPPTNPAYSGGGGGENPLMPGSSTHYRHSSSSCCSRMTSCFGCCPRDNRPVEFEDEIYSEICSNNHTVRHMQGGGGAGGELNPYGTLGRLGGIQAGSGGMMVAPHQHQQLVQMGTLSHYPPGMQGGPPSSTASNQNLMMFGGSGMANHGSNAAACRNSDSTSNPNSTLLRAAGASSRTTMESALYSNLANSAGAAATGTSRPSSMLFNDAGFVRFRMGNDMLQQQQNPTPGAPDEILMQSSGDLMAGGAGDDNDLERRGLRMGMGEGLRASQSFDEAVLLMDGRSSGSQAGADRLSPSSPHSPAKALSSHPYRPSSVSERKKLSRQSPIYKSIDSLTSREDEARVAQPAAEDMYEPPPGMKLPPVGANSRGIYNSGSEYDPTYGSKQQAIYNSSRCSSISATQSFDMRMYGILPSTSSTGASSVAASAQPGAFASTTMRRNEEHKEKLENPYYYYGSTRNQKKQKGQKPRPLLPSQRAQLEQAKKGLLGSGAKISTPTPRPNSRQQTLPEQDDPSEDSIVPPQFQRSRSLGGYYTRQPVQQPQPAPVRNEQHVHPLRLRPHPQAGGSMTPLSYSRWQHAQQQESGVRRYNPLYDTPPTARAANARQQQLLLQQQQQLAQRPRLNHQHPRFIMPEIRGLSQQQQQQQMLSPILTDSNASPAGRRVLLSEEDDYYDDEESDDDDDGQFTSQATQGYSEGLADNESEVSSMQQRPPNDADRGRSKTRQNNKDLHLVSPLEYSAMLKLYGGDNVRPPPPPPAPSDKIKDVTPDSGVIATNSDSNKSRKSDQQEQQVKGGPRKYSRVNTDDGDEASAGGGADGAAGNATGLFSSSSEESESDVPLSKSIGEKKYRALPPVDSSADAGFRWDGSKVSAANRVVTKQTSSDATTDDVPDDDSLEEDDEGGIDGDVSEMGGGDESSAGKKVVAVCKEIKGAQFAKS